MAMARPYECWLGSSCRAGARAGVHVVDVHLTHVVPLQHLSQLGQRQRQTTIQDSVRTFGARRQEANAVERARHPHGRGHAGLRTLEARHTAQLAPR